MLALNIILKYGILSYLFTVAFLTVILPIERNIHTTIARVQCFGNAITGIILFYQTGEIEKFSWLLLKDTLELEL